jgi:hypothetical protein
MREDTDQWLVPSLNRHSGVEFFFLLPVEALGDSMEAETMTSTPFDPNVASPGELNVTLQPPPETGTYRPVEVRAADLRLVTKDSSNDDERNVFRRVAVREGWRIAESRAGYQTGFGVAVLHRR